MRKKITLGDYENNKNDLEAEPITLEKFEDYLKKYGPERAQGYFDAIVDMSKNIDALFYRYDSKNAVWKNASHRYTSAHLKELKEQTDNLIDDVAKDKLPPRPKI